MVGLELLWLGMLLDETLSNPFSVVCAAEGCALSGAELVLLEAALFCPLIFLGGVAIRLLNTCSAAAYFQEA